VSCPAPSWFSIHLCQYSSFPFCAQFLLRALLCSLFSFDCATTQMDFVPLNCALPSSNPSYNLSGIRLLLGFFRNARVKAYVLFLAFPCNSLSAQNPSFVLEFFYRPSLRVHLISGPFPIFPPAPLHLLIFQLWDVSRPFFSWSLSSLWCSRH
jgi:hypothetical protein